MRYGWSFDEWRFMIDDGEALPDGQVYTVGMVFVGWWLWCWWLTFVYVFHCWLMVGDEWRWAMSYYWWVVEVDIWWAKVDDWWWRSFVQWTGMGGDGVGRWVVVVVDFLFTLDGWWLMVFWWTMIDEVWLTKCEQPIFLIENSLSDQKCNSLLVWTIFIYSRKSNYVLENIGTANSYHSHETPWNRDWQSREKRGFEKSAFIWRGASPRNTKFSCILKFSSLSRTISFFWSDRLLSPLAYNLNHKNVHLFQNKKT